MTLTIAIIGIIVIAGFGFAGKRTPAKSMEEWTVSERKIGSLTMWFLQAGEIYTTFTFLGLSGLAFAGGAAAFYAIPYVPLAFIWLYFMGPRVWRLAKKRGYLTQADFFEDRYKSRVLGIIVAILGVVFLIPYLQLQVSGLGTIVQIATGNAASSTISMVIAFVMTIAFVMWAGLKGTAMTSYFKDAIMVLVLLVLAIALPAHFAGGIGGMFHELAVKFPAKLSIHAGGYSPLWFISSMAISTIGGLLTTPHSWPALMSAKSEETLRRNYMFLPLYQIGLVLPMIVGFTAILVATKKLNPNGILLTLTSLALPHWVLGVTVVAGIAAAMVPAAGLLVGITSSLAKNIVRTKSPKATFYVNQVAVVVVTGIALIFAIAAPTLLANLLLLTFSGLAQLAPGIVAGVYFKSMRPRAVNLIISILVGEVIVAYLTLGGVTLGGISPGIVGLVGNLIVLVALEIVSHTLGGRQSVEKSEMAS